jgi:hypothetical protein
MKGSIIAFRLPSGTENRIMLKFVRGLYGQDSKSWHGRYEFHRHGILEDIPYRKFIKGVIVIMEGDIPLVKRYLDEFAAQYYIASARLTPQDEKVLKGL